VAPAKKINVNGHKGRRGQNGSVAAGQAKTTASWSRPSDMCCAAVCGGATSRPALVHEVRFAPGFAVGARQACGPDFMRNCAVSAGAGFAAWIVPTSRCMVTRPIQAHRAQGRTKGRLHNQTGRRSGRDRTCCGPCFARGPQHDLYACAPLHAYLHGYWALADRCLDAASFRDTVTAGVKCSHPGRADCS